MDSRSRQNHRSKKSWVPKVGINPLEKLRAKFEDYDDGSLKVKHYCICGEWFATTGDPLTVVNMKGISTHRQKYRVQKRIAGQLYRWTFNSLSEALAKRDAIFGLVATE